MKSVSESETQEVSQLEEKNEPLAVSPGSIEDDDIPTPEQPPVMVP